MKITAVIPIRKGSKRVPNKNLKDFCGTTLLDLKIQTLLQVPELDEIVVNTDSDEAIQKVIDYHNSKLTYHKREDYFASSQCTGSEFFKHLGETTDCDVFVYAPCTSPFVKTITYRQCISLFLYDNSCNSVTTVNRVKDFMWLDNTPINYDVKNAPNSQNLPDIVALNFGCTVVDKNKLIENANIITGTPKFIITDEIESIDIDTPLDFFIAEQIYKKQYII